MRKGLQVAFAILLFLFLPEVVGSAHATKAPISNIHVTCQIPSYTLVSQLRTARFVSRDTYVPAVFTSAKEDNGSLTASIGVGIVGQEVTPDAPVAASVTAIPTVTPSAAQSPLPVQQGGLSAEALFAMVNEHRTRIGLPPFQSDQNLAQVAQSRAPELQGEIYGGGGMHAGFQRRQLPYWATENMISQQTEADALNWWLNSSVHRGAIEGHHTHASVACEGKNCAMIFTSFEPK